MRSSDEDMVRRALLAVLERLGGGAVGETEIMRGAGVNHSTPDHLERPGANVGGDGPIILVVLGQSNASGNGFHSLDLQPGDARKDVRESLAPADLKSYEREFEIDRRGTKSSHPGLERFSISEEQATPSAPKPCFMEPGRHCVHSGACEMRGY